MKVLDKLKNKGVVLHQHRHHIERSRILAECMACVYTSIETHYIGFALVLVAWLVIDIAAIWEESC